MLKKYNVRRDCFVRNQKLCQSTEFSRSLLVMSKSQQCDYWWDAMVKNAK